MKFLVCKWVRKDFNRLFAYTLVIQFYSIFATTLMYVEEDVPKKLPA